MTDGVASCSLINRDQNSQLRPQFERACSQSLRPLAHGRVAPLRRPDHRVGPADQQRAQVGSTRLADPQEDRLAAAGLLLWRQAEPRGHLSTIVEVMPIPHTGHQRAGGYRADTRNGFEFSAQLVLLVQSDDLGFYLLDLLNGLIQALTQAAAPASPEPDRSARCWHPPGSPEHARRCYRDTFPWRYSRSSW